MTKKPEWCDRVSILNRSFGEPPPIASKIPREKKLGQRNRKCAVDCQQPLSMKAPIRKLSLLRIQQSSCRQNNSQRRSQSADTSRNAAHCENIKFPRIASAQPRLEDEEQYFLRTKKQTRRRRHTLDHIPYDSYQVKDESQHCSHIPSPSQEKDHRHEQKYKSVFDEFCFDDLDQKYDEFRSDYDVMQQQRDEQEERDQDDSRAPYETFSRIANESEQLSAPIWCREEDLPYAVTRSTSSSETCSSEQIKAPKNIPNEYKHIPVAVKRPVTWDFLNQVYTIPPVTPPPPSHSQPQQVQTFDDHLATNNFVTPEIGERAPAYGVIQKKNKLDSSLEATNEHLEQSSILLGSLNSNLAFTYADQKYPPSSNSKQFTAAHNSTNSCYDSDEDYDNDFEQDVKLS
uniref:Uncharacterized protein n=1 Tax=Aureoumbra lagunensis TaxID=44058 RepID=A0A7S3NPF4_9STRA